MAIDQSTVLLKAELETPSVTGRGPVAAAIKAQRASLIAVEQQATVYEALLVDAFEDETNEAVLGKLESLRQTMVAIRRTRDRIDNEQHKLSVALRNLEDEKADILAVIRAEE